MQGASAGGAIPSSPAPSLALRQFFFFFLPSSSHVRECVMCVKSWTLTGESKERKKWGELDVGRWGFRVPHRRDSLRPIRQRPPLRDGVFPTGLDCRSAAQWGPHGCPLLSRAVCLLWFCCHCCCCCADTASNAIHKHTGVVLWRVLAGTCAAPLPASARRPSVS